MQAYKARYERGNFVPLVKLDLPEGSQAIVTVLDEDADDIIQRQRLAIDKFLSDMSACDEVLGPEFDEIINRRFNISRELSL